jgi:hypothetical protein
MSSKASINSQFSQTEASLNGSPVVLPDIPELKALAVQGLVPMFDAEKQMFCHRLVRTESGLFREGCSPRYTIMALLGLHEFERAGARSPFDTQAICRSFVRDTSWIPGVGDLGLTVWLISTLMPDRLEELFRHINLETALDHYEDARQARTTELAWFLAGLSHAALASPKMVVDLTDLAVETYHRMEQNQGEYGIFGHMSTTKSVPGFLRGRIGNFADQIYPIYAMAKFAIAFSVEEPISSALECASAICGAQGSLGQWWWLYDSRTGQTSSRYPVYSVHQQGMAPMGLFALEEATGQSLQYSIYKGLQWIYGANELGADMRDFSQNLIWRCILAKNKKTKYWDTLWSLVRQPKDDAPVGPVEILYEDRPYELGWLLYAFGMFSGLQQ